MHLCVDFVKRNSSYGNKLLRLQTHAYITTFPTYGEVCHFHHKYTKTESDRLPFPPESFSCFSHKTKLVLFGITLTRRVWRKK